MSFEPIDHATKDILNTVNEIRQKGAVKSAKEIAVCFVAQEAFSRVQDGISITKTAGRGTGKSAISDTSIARQNNKNRTINAAVTGTKCISSAIEYFPFFGKLLKAPLNFGIDKFGDYLTSNLDHITPATRLEAQTLRNNALEAMKTGNLPQLNHALIDFYGCLRDHSKNFSTEQKINYLQEVYPILTCYIPYVEEGLNALSYALQNSQAQHEALKQQTKTNNTSINEIISTLNSCKANMNVLTDNMQIMQNSLVGVEDNIEKLGSTVNQLIHSSCQTLKEVNSNLVNLSDATTVNSKICHILFNQYLQVDISSFQGNKEISELYKAFQQASTYGDLDKIKATKNQLDQVIKKERERREQFDHSLAIFNEAHNVLILAANLAGKSELASNFQVSCSALSKIAIGIAWHFGLGTLAATTGPLGAFASMKYILNGMQEIKSHMQGDVALNPLSILQENMLHFQKSVQSSFKRVDEIFSAVFHKIEFLEREQAELHKELQRLEQKCDETVSRFQQQLNHQTFTLKEVMAEQSARDSNRYESFEKAMHKLIAKLAETSPENYAKKIFIALSHYISFNPDSILIPILNENSFYHSDFEKHPYSCAVNHINLFRLEFEKRFQISLSPLPNLKIWHPASRLLATAYLHDTNPRLDSAKSQRVEVIKKALLDGYNLIHFISILQQSDVIPTLLQSYKNSILQLIYTTHREVEKIEQEYVDQHLSQSKQLRRQNIQQLRTHAEQSHSISEEQFLTFVKADICRGAISQAFYGLTFPFGAAKDVATLNIGHIGTRFIEGIFKNKEELLAENIYFVSDTLHKVMQGKCRFESNYMQRKSESNPRLEQLKEEYLTEQKDQDERLWQKAINSLETTDLGRPSMKFFGKISFLPYTLSPSVKMFPYPDSQHKELTESPLFLPLFPHFPHLHNNGEAKFLELTGEKKTVFYYDHDAKNFIIYVFSGPVNADELTHFNQFKKLASYFFENPVQSSNLKEKIWRLWMGGVYPAPSFRKDSQLFIPQDYEVTDLNKNIIALKASNERHLGLIHYLAVEDTFMDWKNWMSFKLKSAECNRFTSFIKQEPNLQRLKNRLKKFISHKSKEVSPIVQEKLQEMRRTELKKKIQLSARDTSSSLSKAIQRVDNEFKFLIGLLSLIFPQIEAGQIGFCNGRSDIEQYLSCYNGEEHFLTHLLENQIMLVDVFSKDIQKKLRSKESSPLVKELQKTCDLLKLALETSASKETLPTPIDSKPKIIDYDKTMRSLNVNEHIRALSDLSRDNRHMHVQHLALFITEDNRESILDILLQFKKDWSPLVRENIYYQLGMHGYKEKPSLIKTLLNGLKDFYPPAQLSAAKALIRLHGLTPEVIETLLSLTQSSVKKISNKAMKLLNLNT